MLNNTVNNTVNNRLKVKAKVLCASLLVASLFNPAFADDKSKKKLAVNKVKGDLSIMVLGSGGPVATPEGRAGAGYMIFTDGKPRILLDVGGGTFQRLAKGGVNVKDLDLVLLSHLHIDHTGDLSSVIKTIYFHTAMAGMTRDNPIHIWGPASNIGGIPSTTEYVDGHYAMPNGVERYLNGFTGVINAGTFNYRAHDLSPDWMSGIPEVVLEQDGLKITAMPVKHGPVPAVAYRIDYKGKSIVYSGDTNSESGNMAMLAKDADLLIYDTAIMDTNPNPAMLQLHTTPSRMGEVAATAMVKKLVLSHITPITSPQLHEVRHLVRAQGFTGKIKAAKDLKVFNLGD
ncbi:MAG: MBL fold metallo-hydrolase [Ectothiorhodospiraceae bacterium]|nr:MBL fold metallo-hydrolase [Ectothiorhodospiraceae bacterium]